MRRAAETVPNQEGLHRQNNLYAVDLFLSGEHSEQVVEAYALQQEKTHIAEGLKLRQQTVRILPFSDGHTRGFGGESMVEINKKGHRAAQKQYLAGDTAAEGLARRRRHDVSIAEQGDELMKNGKIGDGFMVLSPYGEEWDDTTARRLGMWPEYRRSYGWFYRKINERELECVDVSIDRSSLNAYKKFLAAKQTEVPAEAESHDIPGYSIAFKAKTEAARNAIIADFRVTHAQHNHDSHTQTAGDTVEAVAFLDKHAQPYLKLVIAVHKAVAQSLAGGSLTDLVRLSANRALYTLDCLDEDDTTELRNLLAADKIAAQHRNAFAILLTAQRYGVWEAMSKLAANPTAAARQMPPPAVTQNYTYSATMGPAIQAALMFDHIYGNVNDAAERGDTMPGCAGGTSFLKQKESLVKSLIFGESDEFGESSGNDNEVYSFDKKMFCVECQKPPKAGEVKKMCGPCGLCKSCDIKARAKNGSEPLAA